MSSIRNAVDSFNRNSGAKHNFSIDIKHYKSDTYPEMKNPQESINDQLIDTDYVDIAVAIFWTRFGTATKKYFSGTEEEIDILKNSGKQVFLYFCNCPPKMEQLDIEQLQKVSDYKAKRSSDTYFSTYSSTHELEKNLCNHLTQYFDDYAKRHSSAIKDERSQRDYAEKILESAQKHYDNLNFGTAKDQFKESMEIRKEMLGNAHPKTIESLDGFIESLGKLGEYELVLVYHVERLKLIETMHSNKSIEYVKELCKIAYRLDHLAEYNKALGYFNEALDIIQKHHTENKHEVAYIKGGLGFIYTQLNDYDEALVYYKSALNHIETERCGECDDTFISFVYNGIGVAYNYENYELSLDFLNKAVKLRKKISDYDNSRTWVLANTYDAIGTTHRLHQDFEKSIINHNIALSLRQNSKDTDVAIARTHVRIARAYIETKDNLLIAVNYLLEALKIRKQKMGSNNILVAEIFELLAQAHEELQNYETALEFSLNAYKICVSKNNHADNIFEQLERIYDKVDMNALSFDDWLKVRVNNLLTY